MAIQKSLAQRLSDASGVSIDDRARAMKLRRIARASRDGAFMMEVAKRLEVVATQRAAYQRFANAIDDYFECRMSEDKFTPRSQEHVHKALADLRAALGKTK
jgi:hypothetical protein